MRFIRVYDPDNDDIIDLISNNFEVGATEISALYRHRLDIEIFFKWIKQNITVKALYSITEVATLIRISAMERTDLRTLITKQDDSIISNQNVKERTLFDDI